MMRLLLSFCLQIFWAAEGEPRTIVHDLVAGLAALGAGYFAYKHHEKSEEEVRARANVPLR